MECAAKALSTFLTQEAAEWTFFFFKLSQIVTQF